MMDLITNFILSAVASMGFAVFFNIPKKVVPLVGITGGSGWVLSVIMIRFNLGSAWAYFIASILVSFLAEIFARKTHNPSTLFSIPGIYPLVPGYGLYKTMYHFTGGEVSQGVTSLLWTLTNSGAIAVGIITMSSIWGINKKLKLKKDSRQSTRRSNDITEDSLDKMFE